MMRVGLTFDLRREYLAMGYSEEETAEFDSEVVIDGLDGALRSLGFVTDRIGHLRTLAARLVAGSRWDFVFNIAEGLSGLGREAQVPALLDAYGIPYTFSDPLTMALCLDKSMAKRVVRDHGIPTAPFFVLEETGTPLSAGPLAYPVFAKPIGEGTGKGISGRSLCADPAALAAVAADILTRFRQPVLVETFLPGREFTVGITGTGAAARMLGVMEVLPRQGLAVFSYSFDTKEHYEDKVDYRLVDDPEAQAAGAVALDAWRALRCRDGGRVDLRSDGDGRPHFLEANPLAGLHPIRSDLVICARLAGIDYPTLIGRIVGSCLSRIGIGPAAGGC